MVEATTTEQPTGYQKAVSEQKRIAERELRVFLDDLSTRKTVRTWDDLSGDEKSQAASILISELPAGIAAEFINESMPLESMLHKLLRIVERAGITQQQDLALSIRSHAIAYAESFVNEQLENLRS